MTAFTLTVGRIPLHINNGVLRRRKVSVIMLKMYQLMQSVKMSFFVQLDT